MEKKTGCFVTLNKGNELHGCIGSIMPQEELYNCVIGNAINAAVNDPRFVPLKAEELSQIKIEVSVLTVPQNLSFSSPEDLLAKLRPEIDGVILEEGGKSATFLPQVWKQIPGKDDFLRNLCVKAGLAAECWKSKSRQVYTYQAEVFGEG